MTNLPGATSDAAIKRCCAAFWGALQTGAVADDALLDLFARAVAAAAKGERSFEAVFHDAEQAWSRASRAIRDAADELPVPGLMEEAAAIATKVDHWSGQARRVVEAAARMNAGVPRETVAVPSIVSDDAAEDGCRDIVSDRDLGVGLVKLVPANEPLPTVDWKPVDRVPEMDSDEAALAPDKFAEAPRLVLACPRCERKSQVPWNRLQEGRILRCHDCRCHFFASRDGQLTEVVLRSGRWVERHVDVDRRTRRRRFLFGGGAAFTAACAIAWAWRSSSGDLATSFGVPLPEALEDRARLFAEAWLKEDVHTMVRLTDPAMNRSLFLWRRNHPRPKEPVGVSVDIQPQTRSDAVVRFELDGSPAKALKEVRTVWIRREDEWMFQPVTRARG
jgi:hypothetical protein